MQPWAFLPESFHALHFATTALQVSKNPALGDEFAFTLLTFFQIKIWKNFSLKQRALFFAQEKTYWLTPSTMRIFRFRNDQGHSLSEIRSSCYKCVLQRSPLRNTVKFALQRYIFSNVFHAFCRVDVKSSLINLEAWTTSRKLFYNLYFLEVMKKKNVSCFPEYEAFFTRNSKCSLQFRRYPRWG